MQIPDFWNSNDLFDLFDFMIIFYYAPGLLAFVPSALH